jgi:general secretion pathway protein H
VVRNRIQARWPSPPRRGGIGFSLIELLVVLALLAVAVGLATVALRDGKASRLEDEAARLSALLEGARAQARAAGQSVLWLPTAGDTGRSGFQFLGLPEGVTLPNHWLDERIRAEVLGPRPWLSLGPEPVIGPQRVRLVLEDQQLLLGTDGLKPFARAEPAEATEAGAGGRP